MATTVYHNINLSQSISSSILFLGSIYLFSNSVKEINNLFYIFSEENHTEKHYPLLLMNGTILLLSGIFLFSVGSVSYIKYV